MNEVLGLFECVSGKLVVSDPCYGRKHLKTDSSKVLGVATVLENVKVGTYVAVVVRKADVNTELLIWHQPYFQTAEGNALHRYLLQGEKANNNIWSQYSESAEHPKLVIATDSGQAGFFDEPKYPIEEDTTGDYENRQTFYGIACYITERTAFHAGIIGTSPYKGMGVVSASGFGDGCCKLFVNRNPQNEIVACRLVFVTDADLADNGIEYDEDIEEEGEVREPVCAIYCGSNCNDDENGDQTDNEDEEEDEEEEDY